MSSFLTLIILLVLIFVSSTRVEYYTISTLLKLTRSRNISIRIFSILFLPGTIVHEFCHMIMAQLLGVRTTGIELFPRIEHDHVIMGEIGVERTDVFRRILIGAAPFLLGFPIVLLCIYAINFGQLVWWQLLIMIYLVFQITNASFSSSKDMEGSAILIFCLVGILAVFYFLGAPVLETFTGIIDFMTAGQIDLANRMLTIPLFLNIMVWIIGKLVLR